MSLGVTNGSAAGNGGASNKATTVAKNTAAGSGHAVLVIFDNTLTLSSLVDNDSHTTANFTLVDAEQNETGGGFKARLYILPNSAAKTGRQFTATCSGAGFISIASAEITTTNGNGVVLDVGDTELDSSSPYTNAAVSSTHSPAVAIGAIAGNSGANPTTFNPTANGYALITGAAVTNGATDWVGALASKALAATGSQQVSWTDNGSAKTIVGLAVVYEAAGATGYTLTADAASFTLAGQAAGLKAARKASASAASFALTGNAAGLKRGYPLAANTGSFALTGNAATLTAQRKLAAAQGTFTLTGNASALKAARKLAPAAASFALAGVDATLDYAPTPGQYTLSAEPAAFALTGLDAGLTYQSIAVPSAGPTPAGSSNRRRRYLVSIDGQDFPVESPGHARALLERAKELARSEAPERAEQVIAKRLRVPAPQGKPIRVPVPQIYTPDPELVAVVARMRTEINRVYREAALAAEIALRIKLLEEDDDDVLLLL